MPSCPWWQWGCQYNQTVYLDISETGRNISRADSYESNSVFANAGDTIEFTIRLSINGNTTANNVRVSDNLSYGLNYIGGSTTINGSYVPDGLVSSGIYLGNLSPGQTLTIKFRATATGNYLNNLIPQPSSSRAYVFASNAADDSDNVYVHVSSTIQSVIYQSDRIAVQKLGRNITQGEAIEKASLTAYPNDTLEFIIKIRSLYSSTLYNVTVVDALPYGLSYINKTTSVNGTLVSDAITGSGLNIGSLSPNQEVIIRFNALVGPKDYFLNNMTSLSNTVRVYADNTSSVTAQLPISITLGKVAGASISKVAGVATGTAGSLAISLILSALITYSYMSYTKTGLFKKREALAIIKEHRLDKNRFNFVNR